MKELRLPMHLNSVDTKAHNVTLEGSANALAVNKDASQVVVAGRNVFKIFNVESTRFIERLNLRMGKNVDLSYSCADVVWSPVDDYLLATAATNGSVVTWNLNSPHKQDLKFHDHRRTVNKVCFHTSEAHFLLSGSQDGTMKLFDLRKKEAASTFYSLSESVRDVQFCPHAYFSFAAVQESGYVQLWDLRRTDRFERQFAAHSGPVFACDWHPEDKVLFATAGRDKTIKTWKISASYEVMDYCIQTIASVSKVKWRPSRKYNIASSSLVYDFTVNVWDYRRPFVPFAAFDEHKDVVTGFAWCTPHSLLSTSKDCTLVHHVFANATRPADHANPVGLDINPFGDMFYAFKKGSKENYPSAKETSSHSAKGANFTAPKLPFFKKFCSNQDRFKLALSALTVFSSHEFLSMDWFIETAQKYLLHGKPLPDLCEHNANVAAQLKRPHVSQTWLILKLLYTSGSILINEYSHIVSQDKLEDKALDITSENSFKHAFRHKNGGNFRNQHNSSKAGSRHVSGGSHVAGDRAADDNTGQAEEDSDSGNTEHENTITYFASEFAQSDFFFGDGEAELFRMLDYTQLSSLPTDEDWTLPPEAFNIRHRLGDGSPPPEIANMSTSPMCAAEEISEHEYANEEEEQNIMLALCNAPRFPPWPFTSIVVDMLRFYAEQGDVQMAVSVLLVLGEKIRFAVEENVQEQWFHSYLELLSRFQLWNVSNKVIALSCLPAINSLNQQSTVVNSLCGKCNKFINSVGWFCDVCKEMSVCSICHQIVRGVFVWCQGCAHGGHLQHLQEWFKENRQCPTGCGHVCEYS